MIKNERNNDDRVDVDQGQEFIYSEPDFYSTDWMKKEMYSIALVHLNGNTEDARDIIQEVLTDFLTHTHSHRGDQIGNIKGYLYSMLMKAIYNFYKEKERRPERPGAREFLDDVDISPEEVDENDIKEIYGLFNKRPVYLDVLRRRFQGLKQKEIVIELNIPLHTIKKMMREIRIEIEHYLKK